MKLLSLKSRQLLKKQTRLKHPQKMSLCKTKAMNANFLNSEENLHSK